MPDDESRTKQYREIAQLTSEQPLAERTPEGRQLVLPSVLPDAFTDNHAIELEACKRWFSSDAGQVAKIDNPAGYANVRAHAILHQQILLQQAAQSAALASGGTTAAPRTAAAKVAAAAARFGGHRDK